MNVDDCKLLPNFNTIPEFYREVIKCWFEAGGGQKKKITSFSDIRKEVIWGNRYIKFENKCLIFKNWINSGLVYINDIINENGEITQQHIWEKLKCKTNFISEFMRLKKAIPKEWCRNLTKEESIKSSVFIERNVLYWNSIKVDMCNKITNKTIYDYLRSRKFEKSVGIENWFTYFSDVDKPVMSDIYSFIFAFLQENKLKVFRWKLLQYIIPNKKQLQKWKISQDSLCNYCNIEEDYHHFFISCKYLSTFWSKIEQLLKKVNINNKITLKHFVFGYKIFDKDYNYFNYFLTILAYTIYKSYYVSEQKMKNLDVYCLFVKEFRNRLCKDYWLQKSSFLKKIDNYIEIPT